MAKACWPLVACCNRPSQALCMTCERQGTQRRSNLLTRHLMASPQRRVLDEYTFTSPGHLSGELNNFLLMARQRSRRTFRVWQACGAAGKAQTKVEAESFARSPQRACKFNGGRLCFNQPEQGFPDRCVNVLKSEERHNNHNIACLVVKVHRETKPAIPKLH